MGSDFFTLLDELTIARARKHIQKYYAHEMERLGGFAQAQQILSIYRELCSGKSASYEELCNLFDRETGDGQDMTRYGNLLQKATDSIVTTFRNRVVSGLQSGRSFVVPNQSEQATEDSSFELVTWLVIKRP